MDQLGKGASCLIVAVLWITCCHGQQSRRPKFMPGISPSSPNNAINVCVRQATPRPQINTYTATNARIIGTWCSIYDDVIPCLSRTLTTAVGPSDMYLKLIYNDTMAARMSASICQRLPYLYDLSCVDEGMDRVYQCMNWTDSIIKHFYSQFVPARPLTREREEMASVYGCIISVTTAMCFQKELTTCSSYQRKLMYDYYIMLSGKCREVAGIPETTTTVPTTTNSTEPSSTQTSTPLPPSSTQQPTGSNRNTRRRGQNQNNRPSTGWSRSNNSCSTMKTSVIAILSAVIGAHCLNALMSFL